MSELADIGYRSETASLSRPSGFPMLPERFVTTPVTESGPVRMLLNPAVTGQAVSIEHALAILTGIRGDARCRFLTDETTLAEAAVDTTAIAGHRQVTDWHLLNLAARNGAVLVTVDRTIARAVLARDSGLIVSLA